MTELEILQKMLPLMEYWRKKHLNSIGKNEEGVVQFEGYCFIYVAVVKSLIPNGLIEKLPTLYEVGKEHSRFYLRFMSAPTGSWWFHLEGCPTEKSYIEQFYDIRIAVLKETIERLTSFKNE